MNLSDSARIFLRRLTVAAMRVAVTLAASPALAQAPVGSIAGAAQFGLRVSF